MASFRLALCTLLLFFCVFILLHHPCEAQLITPPPPGRDPVEANGRLYNLFYVPQRCTDPYILAREELRGSIIIKDRKVLMETYGPYHVQGNIEVAPSGCLVIMPGVKMYFDPGYGIIVNGTLVARGSEKPGERITMTKNENASLNLGPNITWSEDARLVDGNTTQDGRLDLMFNGKWRGVCTNYNNFTAIDLNVTCRHLGFVYGNFTYHSFARNETDYMLYEKPACTGSENSILDCPGSVFIKYGANICDGQQVVGFQCRGLRPGLAQDHWRGLEFYNATSDIIVDGNLFYNETYSFLEYLDISYAGLDAFYGDGFYHPRASISASPLVPIMNNITVTNGAYDGLNLTEIRGNIHIANSTISHNRGYGIFIKTAVGRTLINMTDINDNWADGLKMYMVNYTINEFSRDYPSYSSFCRTPSPSYQSYPIVIHEDIVDPEGSNPIGSSCLKRYGTSKGKMVTLHVMMLERDADATGSIQVRDGDIDGPILLDFPINNGSLPASVTSQTSEIWMNFKYNIPRLQTGQDRKKRCKYMQSCIRFLMEVTTSEGPDIELRLYNASVSNNTGYGVNVQDMRSKISINSSVIADNGYGAGLRVYQGTGEVALNNTRIERNVKSGVNITYSGGYQLFNLTTISDNHGYGVITEYLRLNRTRIERTQKIEVVRCHFTLNEWTAFRIGNYCLGGEYLFNQSFFMFNKHETIEYLSCNISTTKNTNFSMAFNEFVNNKRHAVLMSPVINTVGIFSNNTFRDHQLGVLRLNNGYDFIENRWYSKFDVDYRMFENRFENNSGHYCVNFRLTQTSPVQKLEFKFNQLVDNSIQDPYTCLNPRSKARAVIVVSSGNVKIQRNHIHNPNSVRDIATHLVDPSVTIDADTNWWETNNHVFVYSRLFHYDDRYNLAHLSYYPVLKENWLYGDFTTIEEPRYRWDFARGTKIGGVLEKRISLDNRIRKFHVDKDIIIEKDSLLTIPRGTTLEFEPSIGMVVHGALRASGQSDYPITFKLLEETCKPLINRTAYESIRLVDGIDEFEGRLELNISGEWGTVCNQGWTILNSGLVCQQLGLTFNPLYGVPRQAVTGATYQRIWLNYVECDELDTNVVDCRAQQYGEFSCDHTQDVFIRCEEATWSGVTMTARNRLAQDFDTKINYLTIDHAGLLDSADMAYAPGLRIDYNFFSISHLTISNCVSDGINIMYGHPYTENLIQHLNLVQNQGNGILTRSPFLQLSHLYIHNNTKAGIMYDPFFTEYQALSVRNFIAKGRTTSITEHSTLVINDDPTFLICPPSDGPESKTYFIELSAHDPFTFRITIQLLDYNPLTSVERLTVYDSRRADISTAAKWQVEEDVVDFPIVSRQGYLTIKFEVNGIRSGRLALAIISKGTRESVIRSNIHVLNATIQHNERGIVTKHYNNPSNERMEIFHRTKKEEIKFESILVRNNEKEAFFVPSLSKYHENFIPTLEEMTRASKVGSITYIIKFANISDNGKGIQAEHNHVDFANNVWKWNVTYTKIQGCASGGFQIELPRVNDMIGRQFHSVSINESELFNNQDFAFSVNGYFAVVDIKRNNIHDNRCNQGVVTLDGMEKQLAFENNRIVNNYAKYAVNMELMSHSEYYSTVDGLFQANVLMGNNYQQYAVLDATTNIPVTYALGIRGVQKIVVRRNALENHNYQYELVAGIKALNLDNKLNVKENFWGTSDQYKIKRRIFDFDDWNNFAIADFYPYLTIADITSDLTTDTELRVSLDPNRLGGRIWQDLTLAVRSDPYIVYSDLTVMPGVTFTIQPGTQLEFYPNIGILVLGKLLATGVPYNRISMRPVKNNQVPGYLPPVSSQLSVSRIRFKGGLSQNEGFLEMFNSTTNSWNLMCDSQFNEKTAEVVCRSLGYETVNVKVRFSYLYDFYVYGKPMYFIKEFWTYSYYCKGNEDNLDMCLKRINYNIKPCIFAANYTFIRCGARNLQAPMDYWGNIRFASAEYEEEIVPFIRDDDRSRLQYVDIYGAGFLHGEKVGAVQTTYVFPIIDHVNITNSVFNGMDVVAPRYSVDILQSNITQNLGHAVNILVLNGDSKTSTQSSFIPLVTNTVPYNLYGLVEICRMEKEITVKNRMIVFYKYSQSAVDCVKIFRGFSGQGSKQVALRFLQFSLFHDDFYRNTVEIFDGKEVTINNMVVELMANSSQSQLRTRYTSTGDTLSIHIHASPSYGFYGFVAEVVTLPLSGSTYPDSAYRHNLKQTVLRDNQDGALLYRNVGEINPSLMIDHCWIENNGIAILNLTSPPMVDIGLQSSLLFNFEYSFVSRNKGGIYIDAQTPSVATKLRSNITNNVFSYGSHGEVLNLTGHHFEHFRIGENYFYNNTAGDYRDIIHVQNVVVNFTFNTVTNNTGHYVLRTLNNDNTEATQLYQKNYFIGNNATALYRALIHVGSGNPQINENYLVNEECDFELETKPLTVLQNGVRLPHAPIDASKNWWGSESSGYVNGKIWDSTDNDSLVAVNYTPIKITNGSLIYGKCAPGWFLESDRCFKFMGAALPFKEANDFCQENGGFLAASKDREKFLQYMIRLTSNVYERDRKVWVYADVQGARCSAFQADYVVAEFDCIFTLLPFVCEKDPYITPPDASIYTAVIGIVAGVFGFVLIVVVIFLIMWRIKSTRRSKERFERQSSMRSSVRGSMKTRSTMSMLSESTKPRHIPRDDYSMSNGSTNGFTNGSLGTSMVSVRGVTEDETNTDGQFQEHRRRQLRQQAEISKGRSEPPPKYNKWDSPKKDEIKKKPKDEPKYDTKYDTKNGQNWEPRNGVRNDLKDDFRSDSKKKTVNTDAKRESPRQLGRQQRANLYRDKSKGSTDELSKTPITSFGPLNTAKKPENTTAANPEPNPIGLENGAFSDSDFDDFTDDDIDYSANEESQARFQPHLEKELDSIQMKSLNGSSMNRGGEPYSPSINVASFTHDRPPTPPEPLPLNIPTIMDLPAKPAPAARPVPTPRPRLSTIGRNPSSSSQDQKISNVELNQPRSVRGSRDRLDEIKQPSLNTSGYDDNRYNTNYPSDEYRPSQGNSYPSYPASKYRDNYGGSRDNIAEQFVGSGVDYLPRSTNTTPSKFNYDLNSDRDSNGYPSVPQVSRPEEYNTNVNSSLERLWNNKPQYDRDSYGAGLEDGAGDEAGVDYLPRRTPKTPTGQRYGDPHSRYNTPAADNLPAQRNTQSRYQPSPGGHTNPAYSDDRGYPSASGHVETNIDSPEASYPESYGYNYRPSVTNLDDVYQNLEQDPVYNNSPTHGTTAGGEYLARNMQNPHGYSSPRGAYGSRDNLHGNYNSYSTPARDDMSNNSIDFEKPRVHKSIETEI